MKELLLTFSLLYFTLSCSSDTHNAVRYAENGAVIIDADFSDSELMYSDFIEEIDFIPLLTANDELIGNPGNIFFEKNRFGFLDTDQNVVWVFDLNGNFRNRIPLKMGRGPGEGIQFDGAAFGKNEFLYVFTARKVITVDTLGNLIKEIQKPVFSPLNDYLPDLDLFISYTNNGDLIPASHNLVLFDNKGTVTDSLLPIQENRRRVFSSAFTHFYTHQNTKYHTSAFSDHIYAIDTKDSLKPAYKIELNQYQIPEEVFDKKKDYPNVLEFMRKELYEPGRPFILSTFETDQYLNIRLVMGNENGHIIYKKITGEVSSSKKMINDFFPNMRLGFFGSYDNHIYGYTSGLALIDYFEENENAITNTELRNSLKQLVDGISDPGTTFLIKAQVKQ